MNPSLDHPFHSLMALNKGVLFVAAQGAICQDNGLLMEVWQE